MVKIKLEEMLKDAVNAGKEGLYTVGLALSYLGLEYIDEHFFGSSITLNLPPETKILSKEFALWGAQVACAWGTILEGLHFLYDTAHIPVKLFKGQYFERNQPSNN